MTIFLTNVVLFLCAVDVLVMIGVLNGMALVVFNRVCAGYVLDYYKKKGVDVASQEYREKWKKNSDLPMRVASETLNDDLRLCRLAQNVFLILLIIIQLILLAISLVTSWLLIGFDMKVTASIVVSILAMGILFAMRLKPTIDDIELVYAAIIKAIDETSLVNLGGGR